MRWSRTLPLFVMVVGLSSCYHATINTGLAPSGETVKKEWATSWLAGLVPPAVVETASQCPNGVAKVETQLSFLNQLAAAVTFGIFTPMTIEVQCAASRSAAIDGATTTVPANAGEAARGEAVEQAVARSLRTGQAAFVVFE